MKSIKQIGLITMMICFLVFPISVSGVVYVNKNATGANNGNSWADAYTTIQAGINDADVMDEEVWIAQGTYPEAIVMKSGVKLYGGFNGTETELNQRNWTINVTTIDASTARGGLPAYHVVIMDSITSSTIDGFTITGGNAYDYSGIGTNNYGGGILCYILNDTNIINNNKITGNSASVDGGGIYCYNSSPAITNNTITGNSASDRGSGIFCASSSPAISNNTISGNSAAMGGGGIYCYNSSPAITNNTITGNSADRDGGGISCYNNSSPNITNNIISGNSTTSNGGGISCDNSSPIITNNTISENSSTSDYCRGGGISCWHNSSPTITNNTISGNSAEYGGGISCDDYSSPQITNNTISGNSAFGDFGRGGGIYCDDYSSPEISNNTISGNSAAAVVGGSRGGGIYCSSSSSAITNNTISGNSALYGGGISCASSSSAITNNTISGNSAGHGGGIYCYNSSLAITTNIISGNFGSGIACDDNSSPQISNNTISGNSAGYGGGISCLNNSSPAITNNTFAGNWAGSGGGIYCTNNSAPQTKNNIFYNNNKYDIYEYDLSSDPTVIYNDFFGNPDGVYYDEGTTPYTSVSTMDSAIAECYNNIGLNPLFVGDTLSEGIWTAAPVYHFTTFQTTFTNSSASWTANEHAGRLLNPDTTWNNKQFVIVSNTTNTINVWGDVTLTAQSGDTYKIFDYHLQLASPCIDAGYDQDVPDSDFDGEPRPMDVPAVDNNGPRAEYDIGADEYAKTTGIDYWSLWE